jgi:5-methylcytosine-specific restriction endonuclease McrA
MPTRYYYTAHWRALRAACLARDRYQCAVAGCPERAVVADHIRARPSGLVAPCVLDNLDNLRSLCRRHDSQVKEIRSGGARRRDGELVLKGCDVNGWPRAAPRR